MLLKISHWAEIEGCLRYYNFFNAYVQLSYYHSNLYFSVMNLIKNNNMST